VYRIDNVTAVPSLPIAGPPLSPGFFTEGNPAAALQATVVDAWWLNLVQEEILTVIDQAGIAPDKQSHTQLYEAIRLIALGLNPDLSGYLPLTGGILLRPGASDLLTMRVDAGQNARMLFAAGPDNTHMWSVGTRSDGNFEIGDWSIPAGRLIIDHTGLVDIFGAGLNVRGAATVAGALGVGGRVTAAQLEISNLLSAWPGNVRVDVRFQAPNLIADNSGVSVWQGLTVVGNVEAAALALGGASGIRYAQSAHWMGFGWDGYLQAFVNTGHVGTLVTSNFALGISVGGLTVSGNSTVTGHGTFGTAGVGADLTVGNSLGVSWDLNVAHFATVWGDTTCVGPLYCNSDLILNHGTITRVGQTDINFQQAAAGGWLSRIHMLVNVFEITGSAHKPGGGEWNGPSDARVKKDIELYDQGLDAIRRLAPVSFRYNGLGGTPDDRRVYHGLVAQDTIEIMPEMLSEQPVKLRAGDAEDTPLYTMDRTPMTLALVNAVKELAEKVEAIERRTR
jgi:Chaperone of endosialidase